MSSDRFDEVFYLAAHPDVLDAVATGQFPSGWAHFVQCGREEGRVAAPDQVPVFSPGETVDEGLVAEKSRLEIAMRSAPRDLPQRMEYFRVLELISQSHFGIFFAQLPEIRTPLMCRSGGSDLWNMRQIFIEHGLGEQVYHYGDYRVPLPQARRILDLGAYAGYTAVYFANRFPEAQIIAVEPSAPSYHVLRANTAAYPNIRCLNAAVWHETTAVATSAHLYGDWGTQYAAADTPGTAAIPAYTITDIMRMHGWDSVDFIKCILEGEQVAVLTAADRPWLAQVSCVATKRSPAGSFPHPGDEAKILAAFPEAQFEASFHAEMLFFTRRHPPQSAERQAPELLRLVPRPPATQRYRLNNASGGFEFYRFDEAGLSLRSNPPTAPPIAITFPVELAGHTRFLSGVASEQGAMRLGCVIVDATIGTVVTTSYCSVAAAEQLEWEVAFEAIEGPHLITLVLVSDPASGPGRVNLADPRLA